MSDNIWKVYLMSEYWMSLILPGKRRMNQRLHRIIIEPHKQLKCFNPQTLTDFVHISFFELLHQLIKIFCNLSEHCHLLYILCY